MRAMRQIFWRRKAREDSRIGYYVSMWVSSTVDMSLGVVLDIDEGW
jgi:hypothetical protein